MSEKKQEEKAPKLQAILRENGDKFELAFLDEKETIPAIFVEGETMAKEILKNSQEDGILDEDYEIREIAIKVVEDE